MNKQLYNTLGIDEDQELKAILSDLEDKQFEYLERSETVSDENRKKEINDLLKEIDDEISDIKEQIKTLSNSVIADDAANTESPKDNAQDDAKSEEISSKVEQFKQKEAEKKAEEVEEEPEQSSPSVDTQSEVTGSQESVHVDNSASTGGSGIDGALNCYKNQDYLNAFSQLKTLAEQGDTTAQFYLAVMYMNGQGTSQSTDRAVFWLKKSADAGETLAQAMYGAMLVEATDKKEIEEGFKNLQLASDSGNTEAMVDFVNACLANKGDKKKLSKAMEYCDKLKLATNDSFNKKKYEDAKAQLKEMKKAPKDNSSKSIASNSSYTKKRIPWKQIVILVIVAVIGFNVWKHVSQTGDSDKVVESGVTDNVSNGTIKITVSSGNIRSGAGKSYDSIGLAHDGEKYEMTGNTETVSGTIWYEIFIDSKKTSTGWVSSKILEVE